MLWSNSLIIDAANPLNRADYFAQGLQAMWIALPGLMGGSKFYNIAALPDGGSGRYHGTLTTGGADVGAHAPIWGSGGARPGGYGYLNCQGLTSPIGYVDCGNVVQGTGPFTLMAWINVQLEINGFDTIISQSHSGENYDLLINQTTNFLSFYLGSGGGHADTTTVPVVGTWYHVAVAFNDAASLTTIYLNANPQGTLASTARNTPSGNFQMGESAVFARPYDGFLDDVRIYNYCMTTQQVSLAMQYSMLGNPGLINRVDSLAQGFLPDVQIAPILAAQAASGFVGRVYV